MADKVLEALGDIASKIKPLQVKVGFMEGATYPDGTSVAMVATSNEFGNPKSGSPPRPFFRNAIAQHESEWADAIARGVEKGVNTETLLSIVGEQIVGDVVQSISTLTDPPLSPVTVLLRNKFPTSRDGMTKWDVVRAREEVNGGPGYFGPVKKAEVDMSNNKPLVWTKVMLRAVDYEVGEIEPSQDSQ